MNEIYCLRVKRTRAGISFPFDRVYLVNHADRACLKELFRFALIMPVEGYLKERLLSVVLDQFLNRQFDRNDDALVNTGSPVQDTSNTAWVDLVNSSQWVMAVPLLTKWAQKKDKAQPRYLIAPSWYDNNATIAGKRVPKKLRPSGENNPSPFPHLTYLQTPTADIRPVCKMCPRFILHQNGECRVGDKVCFEALPLGIQNYFKEGLETPEPSPNIKEPEAEKIINGIIPADNSGKNRIQTTPSKAIEVPPGN